MELQRWRNTKQLLNTALTFQFPNGVDMAATPLSLKTQHVAVVLPTLDGKLSRIDSCVKFQILRGLLPLRHNVKYVTLKTNTHFQCVIFNIKLSGKQLSLGNTGVM